MNTDICSTKYAIEILQTKVKYDEKKKLKNEERKENKEILYKKDTTKYEKI